VLVVCFVSMGWRVGLVVAAAVPLTLAAVFIIMAATGKNFDRITLGSLILALGLLVDDAIIAIEMMVVKMEQGYDRVQASAYAWSHTAAPMLSGTLVTAVGFMPNGFAKSTAGEYTSNMFWIVGIALIASWVVAVVFTPYLGVKLLPHIAKVEGGHDAIYNTPRYNRFRRLLAGVVTRKYLVAAIVVGVFLLAGAGMAIVKKQFFPTSDRPEVLVEVQLPYGSAIERTAATTKKIEAWLAQQKEAKIVTAYIGQGAPRFYLAMSPELPDPSFAKMVIRTDDEKQREALKLRLRGAIAAGLAPEARVRVTQLVFGPYSPYPVAFRVQGPDPVQLRKIATQVEDIMRASPMMRTVNVDWGTRVPALHFVLDQERLQAVGLSSSSVAQQLQLLLSGTPVTAVREDIRSVQVVARAAGEVRLDPARIGALTLVGAAGQRVPLSQVGRLEVQAEEPVLRRRDRMPTMTVRGDIDEALQPPDVSSQMLARLQPVIAALPAGYRIDMAGSIEESGKANSALLPLFPIMIALTLLIIMFQVRSMAAMVMVLATSPLGLIGVVPTLLLFQQPFGINALVGLIALSGILMRNTLILIGQNELNRKEGLVPFDAVIEATVQRARPVILTALAAMLAFIPLTHSVFWGTLAYTLIGGTFAGTVVTLLFLPAMYAIWFRIKPPAAPVAALHARQQPVADTAVLA
jgi:multidrug efflux pump subunit AcrB